MVQIIDGKKIASLVRREVTAAVAKRAQDGHRPPGLATVLVGDDPASQVYVRNKRRVAEECGIKSVHHALAADTPEREVLALVAKLNQDATIDGILVQLPLPGHIDERKVLLALDADKDVDGFHPENVARLVLGLDGFVPCTPRGCVRLLREAGAQIEGAHAVVVGRSNIVGKPMASLLLRENATVTIAHSRTRDLAALCKTADIIVAAVGRPRMIGADHVAEGAYVLDVGINRGANNKLVGDVDFEAVKDRCAGITPVPGGVGPMTIACLMENTAISHARRLGIS